MLKITDLIINVKETLGNQLLLVDVQPVYLYKDGKRTKDIEGYRYIVALPEHGFERVGIKILGKQLLSPPEGYLEVTFEGLELFLYWMNGQYNVGARATGIKVKSA